jgi:hypothetical protein
MSTCATVAWSPKSQAAAERDSLLWHDECEGCKWREPVSCWRPGSICRVHTVILLLYFFMRPHRVVRTLELLQAAKHFFWIYASFDKLAVYTAVSASILECDIVYFGRTLSCFGERFCLSLQGKEEFAIGIGTKEVYCFAQGLRPRPSSS